MRRNTRPTRLYPHSSLCLSLSLRFYQTFIAAFLFISPRLRPWFRRISRERRTRRHVKSSAFPSSRPLNYADPPCTGSERRNDLHIAKICMPSHRDVNRALVQALHSSSRIGKRGIERRSRTKAVHRAGEDCGKGCSGRNSLQLV